MVIGHLHWSFAGSLNLQQWNPKLAQQMPWPSVAFSTESSWSLVWWVLCPTWMVFHCLFRVKVSTATASPANHWVFASFRILWRTGLKNTSHGQSLIASSFQDTTCEPPTFCLGPNDFLFLLDGIVKVWAPRAKNWAFAGWMQVGRLQTHFSFELVHQNSNFEHSLHLWIYFICVSGCVDGCLATFWHLVVKLLHKTEVIFFPVAREALVSCVNLHYDLLRVGDSTWVTENSRFMSQAFPVLAHTLIEKLKSMSKTAMMDEAECKG